jgi:hypothetical protein
MSKRQRYIENKIKENLLVFFKYRETNPKKSKVKFGSTDKELSDYLNKKYNTEYTNKVIRKRYNRN